MKYENESENEHFCKIEGYARFCKNDHFPVHSGLILKFILEKWDSKWDQNEPKMTEKWLLWTTLIIFPQADSNF
jgi:hypothetical protein